MSDNADFGAGGAMAAMHLHLALFKVFIKRGLLTPADVRDMIDIVLLGLEREQGAIHTPDTARALAFARHQATHLLKALEATTLEMKASPRGP